MDFYLLYDVVGYTYHARRIHEMRTSPKCEICKVYSAEYALQYIGDDIPQFYLLGWYIRGFDHTKVCSDCKSKIRADAVMNASTITSLKGCKI